MSNAKGGKVDIFQKGKFDLLALTETKLKGEGEVLRKKINGLT